jgi:hypothetical protein
MKTMSKLAVALVGAAGLAVAAESVQAQTVVLNGTGSSAGRQFAGLAPLFVCDTNPTPQYFNGGGNPPNLTEWQCNRGGVPHIIRYTSGASADGYEKQPNGQVGTVSVLNTSGCPAGTLDTNFRGTGRSVIAATCSANTLPNQPVHYGAADVKASSLHQTIFGSTQTPPAKGHLTTTPVVTVPFAIVVGADVRGKDSSGNPVQLLTLQEEEIRQILAGIVTDWAQLGYTTVNGTASTPITVCQRTIGSGTLATIDEVIMRPKFWVGSFFDDTLNGAVSNAGSGNMQTCLGTNKNSIGYIDSDSVKGITGGGVFGTGAYQVGINGYQVNTGSTVSSPVGKLRLKDLRCGRYIYWADWNFVNRTQTVDGSPVNAVSGTNAAVLALRAAMINHNPLPDYWLSTNDSFVQKGDDRGPMSWQDPTNNGENLADVCRYAGSTF